MQLLPSLSTTLGVFFHLKVRLCFLKQGKKTPPPPTTTKLKTQHTSTGESATLTLQS